jgi:hypothetical protein
LGKIRIETDLVLVLLLGDSNSQNEATRNQGYRQVVLVFLSSGWQEADIGRSIVLNTNSHGIDDHFAGE